MKLAHLAELPFVCPACGTGELKVWRTIRRADDELEEGLLLCGGCDQEFPVIDGIPLLVKNLRAFVNDQLLWILQRGDLSETIVTVLGECSGSMSPFDARRQHLSMYASGHWGDLDPGERSPNEHPGSISAVLVKGLERLAERGSRVEGPVLDLGCSLGRTTHELDARRTGGGIVVGLDLNFAMLKMARRALREGKVSYARRRSGLLYESRSFDVPRASEDVTFVCADVLALPFKDGAFGLATSLNLVDVVPSPLEHLRQTARVLRPGGALLLASPFDWSPNATPVEGWIGGHSPRGASDGRPEAVLRSLLGGGHSVAISELELLEEVRGLAWDVRLHDRSVMRYDVHLFVARKRESAHAV